MKGKFYFDPCDRIYSDHFPGNPVVPGSLIINAFLEAGKTAGFEGIQYTIENFRFREFVSPGEYDFGIEFLQDRLKCTLYQDRSHVTKPLVTGTIRLSEA